MMLDSFCRAVHKLVFWSSHLWVGQITRVLWSQILASTRPIFKSLSVPVRRYCLGNTLTISALLFHVSLILKLARLFKTSSFVNAQMPNATVHSEPFLSAEHLKSLPEVRIRDVELTLFLHFPSQHDLARYQVTAKANSNSSSIFSTSRTMSNEACSCLPRIFVLTPF